MHSKSLAPFTKEAGRSAPSGGGAGRAAGSLGERRSPVTGGGGSACGEGRKVRSKIQGGTADPKFIPDVGGLAKDLFKSQLGCIGGKSPAGATKAQGQNPADAINALGGLFKKKKP